MKKLKLVSFVIFCISLAASLIFWFTQVRKGDRIGPVITMDQQELTVGSMLPMKIFTRSKSS